MSGKEMRTWALELEIGKAETERESVGGKRERGVSDERERLWRGKCAASGEGG